MHRGRPRKPVSPCRFCNITFKRAEHLRRHERIHTQEKPFKCVCGQAFSRKDLLVRHTKLSHPDIEVGRSNNAEGSLTERESREQITTARTATWSAHSLQPQSSIQRCRIRSRSEDITTDTSDVPQRLSGYHASLSAQSPSIPDDTQLVGEGRVLANLTNVTSCSYDQFNYHVPPQYLGDSAVWPPSDIDFPWDWDLSAHDFLPATFFDSEQPLSDLWRMEVPQHNSNTDLPANIVSGSVLQNLGNQQSAIAAPLYKRLPPLEPDYEISNNQRLPIQDLQPGTPVDTHPILVPDSPWNISVQTYKHTSDAFVPCKYLVEDTFSFPSRRTLSRFLEAYFQDFHQHFPFLHVPTTIVSSLAPELVLAMAAAGAWYRFEDNKGYALHVASKAIIMHKITVQKRPYNTRHLSSVPHPSASLACLGHNFTPPDLPESNTDGLQPEAESRHDTNRIELQTMQALIIITALASWSDKYMSQEALVLSSQLAILVRKGGISTEDQIAEGTEWLEWIHREERRRTLFVAYVLFNMQSIAFNVPPTILNQDVCLCLPHCGSEWEATSASEFMHLRRLYGHDERSFRGALEEILHARNVHAIGPLSAFGNYVLMIGLVQQIFLERHVLRSLSSKSMSLTPDNLKTYEAAFKTWHRSWEATQESSLDPSSPKGPLGFDAAALLWLGYIRLNADLGPHRDLMSKDPQTIARTFVSKDAVHLTRSPHLDRAVLQCIHALSRPVRVGIPFVARTMAPKRSVQHALCSLECACLLSRWLNTIADAVAQECIQLLREDERRLLGMVASLIRETDLACVLDQSDDDAKTIRRMAATIVRLWAGTFGGQHVFHIVDAIGTTLAIVADMLEAALNL